MLFFKPKPKPEEPPPPKPVANRPFFPWAPAELSVGVAAIDKDHKHLADLINQVHAALILERDRAHAAKIMEELLLDIRGHFFRDEQAMEETGYPDMDAHAAEHFLLLKEAKELARQLYAGTLSALVFPTFLRTWFIGHTKGSDRRYGDWKRETGPS